MLKESIEQLQQEVRDLLQRLKEQDKNLIQYKLVVLHIAFLVLPHHKIYKILVFRNPDFYFFQAGNSNEFYD